MTSRPQRNPALVVLALAVLLLTAGATADASVVIYRCTDAGGATTFQNDVPCPKGATQLRRVMEVASPAAAPRLVPTPAIERALPAPPAAAAQSAAASPPTAERLPPPALFECRTWDDRRYLGDDAVPPQRCAPLQTTGIGGAAGMGAGAACEMVTDRCQQIAEEALCDGWQRRLREAEAALRFGRFESRQAAQAEVARVERIGRESTCGG